MTWLSGFFVYAIVWWLVLFMVLPWGVRPPDVLEKGHMSGAPDKPHMWKKLGATTAIAAAFWLLIHFLIEAELLSFRPPD